MKARIVYDADGTHTLTVTGHHLSTQLWNCGKALIQATNRRGRLTRAVHATRTHTIDVTPSRPVAALAAGAAVAALVGVALYRRRSATKGPTPCPCQPNGSGLVDAQTADASKPANTTMPS